MTQIKDILIETNTWWKTPFTLDYKERDIYTHITKYLTLPHIIAFTGLRRVGKTTLMLKILHDHLDHGNPPHHIIYFSFDEFRTTPIRDILHEYEQLHQKNLNQDTYLLLLDEIQKLDHWEDQLKSIYDIYSKNIKIIITGSESLFIKKKSKETLAGRIFQFKINPLTFKEFLRFKEKTYTNIHLYKKELTHLFQEYLPTQGFPELVHITDQDIITKYIKESIIEKVIYRDIVQLYNIKDISILESLLHIFMENPGKIINLTDLGNDLLITRQTLSNYIRYLEESFLIRKLYNYSRNQRKTERKLKKYYPTILSPNLIYKKDTLSQSKAFESLLINQLNAEYFWRDPYKHEVDIIQPNDTPHPIEIKYGKIETKNLLTFMKKYHVTKGQIISSNQEQKITHENKHITITPAYKYLLQ
ncbi:MAG: ATP-binding protein [Candidatus Thermoplasmatota archaeon]|nr:ATP-binding protein [Candidatus Thermoplasmatota archaeon]MBU1941560.1 ATP-binding protein [Candidatus Thermoplasmatota archaeon]